MVAESGPKVWWGRVPPSTSPWAEPARSESAVSAALPEDVRQFLLRYIDSVEQLEVLLLLCGSPSTAWSPEAVAQALYSNPTSVAYRLAMLQRHELIAAAEPPTFAFLMILL